MQDVTKTFGAQGPVSAMDEDHEQVVRQRDAAIARQEVEDYNQGEIALLNAAYNDEDVAITGTGKIIRGNRTRHNKYQYAHEFGRIGMGAILESMAAAGAGLAALQEMAQGLMSATGAFGVAASKKSTADFYEDETHIYETEQVDHKTYLILSREIARVRKVEQDLQSVDDAEMQAIIKAELKDLAETYEMRIHPLTGHYIHSLDRVLAEKARLNVAENDCKDSVGVFYLKGSAHDSRRRNVVLGDQYDQQTKEVIATDSDNVVAEARPIAPPEFHNV